jgi:hypothetical protein
MKRSTGYLMTGLVVLSMAFANSVDAKPKAIKAKANPTETVAATEQRNTLISGKQYIVLGGGTRMIPDNVIFYQSCDKVDCANVQSNIIKNLSEAENQPDEILRKVGVLRSIFMPILSQNGLCIDRLGVNSVVCKENYERMMKESQISQYKTDLLLKQFLGFAEKGNINGVRTDFEGNYSLTCPSAKCLVFSVGKTSSSNGFWMKIVDSGSKFDLTNSSMIHSYNE